MAVGVAVGVALEEGNEVGLADGLGKGEGVGVTLGVVVGLTVGVGGGVGGAPTQTVRSELIPVSLATVDNVGSVTAGNDSPPPSIVTVPVVEI